MLREHYFDKVRDSLKSEINYKNAMQIPCIEKVCVNVGLGVAERSYIESVVQDLTLILGQTPCITKASTSVSNFKLREGMTVGCKATLRRNRMYRFLERLLYIALPRSRDFKPFDKKGFDGSGNYSFGIKEQNIFPEAIHGSVSKSYGMDITIVTSTSSDQQALLLLKEMKFPFRV